MQKNIDEIGILSVNVMPRLFLDLYTKIQLRNSTIEEGRTMLCQTIKVGTECFFMGKQGCSFNGGTCYPVVESCQGCGKALTLSEGTYCQSCPDPQIKWKNGSCNLATHVKSGTEKVVKLNPLKASKRSRR
jgi:hypothetical protein